MAESTAPAKTLSPLASLLAILGLSMIWGYHWAVMKIGLGYSGALTYSAMRCLIGGPLLLAIAKLQGRSLRIVSPKAAILVGLFQTAGNFGLGAIAVKFGEAGKSAVLTYTMPFWVLVIGYLVLKERAGPRRWIAASLAMIGTLLVALAGGRAQLGPVLFALAAGVSWGAGVLLYQWSSRTHRDDAMVFAGWQLLVAGIFMAVFIPASGESTIQWTPAFMMALSYTVILATALAVYLWFLLIARLEAGMASLGILLSPAIGLASSWVQLGERPPPVAALGLGIILFAIAFFAWAEWQRAQAAKLARA
jgi:drug/metabolite transporter (DMT)-like permease